MKLILVPTDFSDVAKNALLYAAELALNTRAKLILLNVYDTSLIAGSSVDVYPIALNTEEIESRTKLELEKEKKMVERKFGTDLVTEIEFRWGFTVQEINRYAEENNVDLIVMGMHGTDYFTERFLGSTPTMTLRNATCPVLIVGDKMEYKRWKKMVLTIDGHATDYEPALSHLKKLARLFHAQLSVLHISPAYTMVHEESNGAIEELEEDLVDIDHSMHFRTSNDVIKEINEFVFDTDANVVVMMPKKHSILEGILEEAKTKKMAFHAKVPLLCLHE